ncbi:hypothetical protein IWZ00DRAFT_564692 [Phyllosticta capitalensis]
MHRTHRGRPLDCPNTFAFFGVISPQFGRGASIIITGLWCETQSSTPMPMYLLAVAEKLQSRSMSESEVLWSPVCRCLAPWGRLSFVYLISGARSATTPSSRHVDVLLISPRGKYFNKNMSTLAVPWLPVQVVCVTAPGREWTRSQRTTLLDAAMTSHAPILPSVQQASVIAWRLAESSVPRCMCFNCENSRVRSRCVSMQTNARVAQNGKQKTPRV